MSKKPKRSRHRIPDCAFELRSDPIDERYQAEIDASTRRLEQRYRKAEQALAKAEAKAERLRIQIDALAEKQREAARIAAHRAQEQQRVVEYIERIRVAAQQSRMDAARAELERKYRDAVARRNAQTAARKAEAKAARQHDQQLILRRREYDQLLLQVQDRRRELHEIELLMQADGYARDSRRRRVRHEAGAITIPLGGTTGVSPKSPKIPTFPVTKKPVRRLERRDGER